MREWFLQIRGDMSQSSGPGSGSSLRPSTSEPARVEFALEQNRPNPFAGRTQIEFDLPQEMSVRLEVFDLSGRRLRTLCLGTLPGGHHSAEWDRRDSAGNQAHPGVYLYRLVAGRFRGERKMVLTE